MSGSTPDALWSSSAVRLLQPTAVACHGVRKRVGRQQVLAGVELSVAVGARLLLVSQPEPAAGLLLRVLAGLARPDGGRIELAGVRQGRDAAGGWGRRVAYVGPRTGLYPWMSPREALALSAKLAGLTGSDARERIEGAIGRWGLGAGIDRPMRRGGAALTQRTAMAAALLSDPEVVLLDEPLRAVEPDERIRLLRIPGKRLTVVLASRYPASEAGVVQQVALLREGRLAVYAPVAALEWRHLPLSQRGIEALADVIAGSHAGSRANAARA